jgi:rhodanese-related sulfurtransferase
MSGKYRGDIDVQSCFQNLQSTPSFIIDVRTQPEWSYVGLPSLPAEANELILICWQEFPTMETNPKFAVELTKAIDTAGGDVNSNLYFLCRSGVRSRAAAITATTAGYLNAYNVEHGFEGDPNISRHRGLANGWKAAGLPWKQS